VRAATLAVPPDAHAHPGFFKPWLIEHRAGTNFPHHLFLCRTSLDTGHPQYGEESLDDQASKLEMCADIVSAYVSNNTVSATDLSNLIQSVYGALGAAGKPMVEAAPETKATPAQIRKSITDAGLISFEDGKTYQSLKRNLSTRGMTPEQYREKWGLPRDYPMVSPSYAAKRSELAKSMGLGQRGASKK
jgi:predicted transcriptional regulator